MYLVIKILHCILMIWKLFQHKYSQYQLKTYVEQQEEMHKLIQVGKSSMKQLIMIGILM